MLFQSLYHPIQNLPMMHFRLLSMYPRVVIASSTGKYIVAVRINVEHYQVSLNIFEEMNVYLKCGL